MTSLQRIEQTLVLLVLLPVFTLAEHTLQTFNGVVGGGNYSYYKLTLEGDVLLILTSITGDGDIYVSQKQLQPTYDPDEHCMQAATCGVDHVLIPKEFSRPVGIGIYGHPSHEVTTYKLEVLLDSYVNPTYSYNEEEASPTGEKKFDSFVPPVGKEEDESILWAILVGILKILLEVLAS